MTAGIAALFFAMIVTPASCAESPFNKIIIKNRIAPIGSENRSAWNYTLPTVHINYPLDKWKWGVVQFDDFNPDFDLNYSSFGTNMVILGFNETLKCYTQAQILPAWSEVSVTLFWNESFIGGIKQGQITWSKWNWTTHLHLGYFAFQKEIFNNTDIHGRITLTGFPLRLHLFAKLVLPGTIFWWALKGNWLLPFEERHGTTVEFAIHIHD